MSKRYEFNTPDCELELIQPEDDLLEESPDDHYGLAIGNPWASAYLVVGSLADLQLFARRIAYVISLSQARISHSTTIQDKR